LVGFVKDTGEHRQTGRPDQQGQPHGGVQLAKDLDAAKPSAVRQPPVNFGHEFVQRLAVSLRSEIGGRDVREPAASFPIQSPEEADLAGAQGASAVVERFNPP
jgi:hypothetical protein